MRGGGWVHSVRKTSIAEVCKAVKDVAGRKKIVCEELEKLRNMSFGDIEADKLWTGAAVLS